MYEYVHLLTLNLQNLQKILFSLYAIMFVLHIFRFAVIFHLFSSHVLFFFFVYKIFTHFAFASVDEFANHSVQSIALHYRLGISLQQFSRIYQRITVCSLDSPTYKQTNIHMYACKRSQRGEKAFAWELYQIVRWFLRIFL